MRCLGRGGVLSWVLDFLSGHSYLVNVKVFDECNVIRDG